MAVEYGNQSRGEFKQNLYKMRIENVYVKILWRGSKRGKLLYTSFISADYCTQFTHNTHCRIMTPFFSIEIL